MNGLICAADDCLYNDKHRCISKRVNLSDYSVITVHEGRQHFWLCKQYEQSERANDAIMRRLKEALEADANIQRFCEQYAMGSYSAREAGEALRETIRRMSDAEEL